MVEKINSDDKNIIITLALTLKECKTLKSFCMEVLGNYRWKVDRKRASALNKILDKLEEVEE